MRSGLNLLLRFKALTRRRPKGRRSRSFEALDRRELLSTVPATIAVLAAGTGDSKGVTVSYEVTGPEPSLSFGVYRSASPTLDASAVPVASPIPATLVDDAGRPSTAPGLHTLTIPLAGGLPINPKHPYVVVAADPGTPSASLPGGSASFRKVSIAVITHGGLQDSKDKKFGPGWERQMAASLRAQGYDDVIAYNWVAQSGTPGQAAKQGPKLAKLVLNEAAKVASGEPVDLHFIGHSEGTVVNMLAIERVEAKALPAIRAGYLEDTLLDPHAANPDTPGKQYSVADNFFGWASEQLIDNYQARARDPLVKVPAGVSASEVFYQQTPASHDHGSNLGAYNLWGQVPVPGASVYFNLTAAGAVHSGADSVHAWYERNVVPTLGDGGQPIARQTLTAALQSPTTPGGHAIASGRATYAGTSEPGSTVDVLVGPAGPGKLAVVGQAIAGSVGTWTVTTRPLSSGRYRVVVEAHLTPDSQPGREPVPTAAPGLLVVQG